MTESDGNQNHVLVDLSVPSNMIMNDNNAVF